MTTGNESRDTPGRVLILWVILVLSVVVFSWRLHFAGAEFNWVEYPTGLGDTRYYVAMIGENDFFGPNLKFKGHEKGLFRRTFNPLKRDDARMRKVGVDSTGRHFVYMEMASQEPAPDKGARRSGPFFLKSDENAYIEFGERKYYPQNPDDVPVPKAIPLAR